MHTLLVTILVLQSLLLPQPWYGGYHWGSKYVTQATSGKDKLTWGVDQNVTNGVVRVYLGYHTVTSYDIEPSPIEGQTDYLLRILQTAPFVALMNRSDVHTVLFTCYTYDEFRLSRHWDQLDTSKVTQEYLHAATWLGQFRNKTSILLPWEGDNETYGVENLLAYYAQDMAARIAGINLAGQPNVFSGMEVNDVHGIVLSLVPELHPGYVFYTAWKTTSPLNDISDPTTLFDNLRSDIQVIKERIGTYYDPSRIGIGEFGRWPNCATPPNLWFQAFDRAIRFEGIRIAIYWQITADYSGVMCLYDEEGNRTVMGDMMYQFSLPPVIIPPKKWKGPIYEVPLPLRPLQYDRGTYWYVSLPRLWGDGSSWDSPSQVGSVR